MGLEAASPACGAGPRRPKRESLTGGRRGPLWAELVASRVLDRPDQSAGSHPERPALLVREVRDGTSEDEGDDGRELHDNVERRARGVLERVADGVAGHGVLVGLGALHELLAEAAGGDVLLGVVPGAAGVAHGDGELHAGDQRAGEEARARVLAEAQAGDERAQDHECPGRKHLAQGGLGGDADAPVVVRGHLLRAHDLGELREALLHHVVGGHADGLHGPRGEGVGHHRAEEEAGEDPRVEDVHVVHVGAHAEGAEERQADQGGGADGEALADGCGGVAGGIEAVGEAADRLREAGHLGDAARVVGDGAVGVNGEGHGHGAEHAQGGQGHAEHAADAVRHEDGHAQGEHRDDAGEVAEGEAVDDARRRGLLLGLGDLAHRRVAVRGVVLGHEADEEAGPEAHHDGGRAVPPLHVLEARAHRELLREAVLREGDDHGGHEDRADHEDALQGLLDVGLVLHGVDARRDEERQQPDDDAGRGDEQRVHEGAPVALETLGRRGQHEGGAGGLREGAEEVGAHAGDVADVVAHVVGDARRVAVVVLLEAVVVLAGEVGADVGGLRVDAAAHAAEEGHGGATEAVAGDGLEHLLLALEHEELLEGEDQDEERDDADGDEGEAHDAASLDGHVEASLQVLPALVRGPHVGVHGDLHADPAAEDGGDGADHEGDGGRGAGEDHQDDGEEHDVDGHVEVLGHQEGHGAVRDGLGDLDHLLDDLRGLLLRHGVLVLEQVRVAVDLDPGDRHPLLRRPRHAQHRWDIDQRVDRTVRQHGLVLSPRDEDLTRT
mmetsp:Transcript_8153/g.17838  ORF Transcript_8153/g.17838 Transcript_8153/m.17838 type:complete len:783 (-) Transcript_8153:38-2386(-)